MEEINLADKVVIITGASSGIGAETAIAFSGYGAKLTLVGRHEGRLMSIAEKCTTLDYVPLCLLLDLTKEGSCEKVIKRTVETFGKIDILVNCAGKIVLSSLHDRSMDAFDEVMNINFRVPFHLSQLALPYLIKTKGNIVNIGSSLCKRFKPGFLPYIVTKSALALMAQHSAPELLSEEVRINTISPGMTRTNIMANLNIKEAGMQKLEYERMADDLPNGQIIDPKEVASFVCLIASDVFPSVNGTELLIDGTASMT